MVLISGLVVLPYAPRIVRLPGGPTRLLWRAFALSRRVPSFIPGTLKIAYILAYCKRPDP